MSECSLKSFSVGNLVNIFPESDVYENFGLHNTKAEILEIDAQKDSRPIRVLVESRSMPCERLEKREGWFSLSEIELVPGGWTSERRAHFLYGRMGFRQLLTLKRPWEDTCRCMHVEHTEQHAPASTRRIMVNVWGSIYDMDVCKEHERLDGLCFEEYPGRIISSTKT